MSIVFLFFPTHSFALPFLLQFHSHWRDELFWQEFIPVLGPILTLFLARGKAAAVYRAMLLKHHSRLLSAAFFFLPHTVCVASSNNSNLSWTEKVSLLSRAHLFYLLSLSSRNMFAFSMGSLAGKGWVEWRRKDGDNLSRKEGSWRRGENEDRSCLVKHHGNRVGKEKERGQMCRNDE